MKLVYRTILQVTIISRVIAISLQNIIKALPTDVPADIKNAMLEMFSNNTEEFTMSDMEGANDNYIQSVFNVNQKESDGLINTASTVSIHQSVTNNNKPITMTNIDEEITNLPVEIAYKPVKVTNKPVTLIIKPVAVGNTPIKMLNKPVLTKANNPKIIKNNLIMRSGNINTEGTTLPNKGATTPKPEKENKPVPLPIPPPEMAIPIPMPMPIPYYARVPVMLPMKSYFEPVIHDHPPLYLIKEMIEKDEKKCKEDENSKQIPSASESGTDTGTENSSEYIDVGGEYYDDVMHIQRNHD